MIQLDRMQAQFRSGLATVSAVEERRNEWHDVDTWEATRRIADLSEDARLQQLMLFICVSLIGEPERVRRLLSHTGAIDGIDHGNIVYYMVYRSLLDNGSHVCRSLNHARTFTQPNNCGNLLETVLVMADLAPSSLPLSGRPRDDCPQSGACAAPRNVGR